MAGLTDGFDSAGMQLMRLSLLVAAMLTVLTNALDAEDKPIEGDLAKLQGIWSGPTGRNGMFLTTWTIKGEIVEYENITKDGKKIGGVCKVAVDERAKPHKAIDQITIAREGGNGSGPKRVLGIYEFIDEDTIRICNDSPKRPTEFKFGENGPPVLFTLRREPPGKKAN